MQESHSSVATEADIDQSPVPLHDDIVQCARDLWVQYGKPADRDLEIWLEAEQRLFASAQTPSKTKPALDKPVAPLPVKPSVQPAASAQKPVSPRTGKRAKSWVL